MTKRFSLVGINGNAYSVMGYTARCMKEVGYSQEEITEFYELATKSDYYNLIAVSQEQIDKCNNKL